MADKLERYSRSKTPYPPLQRPVPPVVADGEHKPELPQLVKQLRSYKAVVKFLSNENTDRFRIIDAAGNIDFYSYNHLIEGSYRDGQLTLVTSSRSFVLSGRNLDQVIDQLTEQKVKALCAFAEGLHEPVSDPKEVFIEGIARE